MVDHTLDFIEVAAEKYMAGVLLDFGPTEDLLVTVYPSPSEDIECSIDDLLHRFSDCSVLLWGDFNVKNRLWGNPKGGHRAHTVLDLVSAYRFRILNVRVTKLRPSMALKRALG